jgi:hypothetical protein
MQSPVVRGRLQTQAEQNKGKQAIERTTSEEKAKLRKINRQPALPSCTAKDSPAHYSPALHNERAALSSAR